MKPSTKILLMPVIALCLAVLVPALLVLYADPFQIYHKPLIKGMGLHNDNQRYQNAGLINSWLADSSEHYDSVILGTSLSANFSADTTAQLFNRTKSLRLIMHGGSPEELASILQHALNTGRVHQVLWELHPWAYADEHYQALWDPAFPRFLYDNSLLNDYPYLLNQDSLVQSWNLLLRQDATHRETHETFARWAENPATTHTHQETNSETRLKELRQAGHEHITPMSVDEIHQQAYLAVSEYVEPALHQLCNGPVETILYMPPFSLDFYARQGTSSRRVIYMPRYLLQRFSHCRNIHLYAFDDMDFTKDLNNYRDELHYLPHISNALLEMMSQHQHELTLDNVANYETNFIDRINRYEVYSSYPDKPTLRTTP